MNIRFSGFGGQGIILAGVIYGRAAVIDGKNAVQTQSYGSASRGGACKSDVIISDEEIYELEFPQPDVLIVMIQEAYEKHFSHLMEDGILIVEKDLVQISKSKRKAYAISFTEIAEKEFGRKIMANMVMIGYMTALLSIVSKDAVQQAIRENVPPGTEDKNIEAFEKGYALGLEA